MRSNYKRLGDYIRQVDVRNVNAKEDNLLGVSTQKFFMPSIANTVGTDFSKYKVVKCRQFTYVPDTSRRGDRIGIALLQDYDEGLVSNVYTVFEIIDNTKLLPEYLMLWFMRPEFDRYARFMSHGSVREIFGWDEMCDVALPVPDIKVQQQIVDEYNTVQDRIRQKLSESDILLNTLKAVYQENFACINAANLPEGWSLSPLFEICSKIGSGATPRGGKESYQSEGIHLIRSTNVFDYCFCYDNLACIDDMQAKQLDGVTIEKKDVLFNITGVSVARCCIVPGNVLPARVNQHVMIIRPKLGMNMSLYLLCVLCSFDVKQKLLGASQAGSTREAITKQEMENFKIICPDEKTIHKFGEVAVPLYGRTVRNSLEINKLQEFMQLLLSKLSTVEG